MLLSHVTPFKIAKSFVAYMRLTEVFAHYYGFEGHEVQLRTVKFVMILVWAELASLIFEGEADFLLVVYCKVMLLIEIALSDDIYQFRLFYLHDQRIFHCYEVESDLSSSIEEIVS